MTLNLQKLVSKTVQTIYNIYTPFVQPHRGVMELPFIQDKLAPQSISIGSAAWFTWLANNKSFRYSPSSDGYNYLRCDITVRNRTKDYWYAYRKVNGVQRTYYLGKTKDLDYEKLQQAVDELSLSDFQYHKLISDRKAGVHNKFVQPITGEEELSKLQLENKQLKEKLAIAEEIIEVAREVVNNIIPSKSNMVRGKALIKLRDKLNSIH